MCIGLIVLADLLGRAADLELHYTDAGILPREDLGRLFGFSRWYWSAHLLTGSVAGQAILFCAAAVVALALTIGYRTRLATILTWFLLVSLQARNPLLLYGADQLLRMLLFWSIFLPLGSCWSFDRVRRGGWADVPPGRHLSMASAAILLQMFLMYFFSGLLKRDEGWQSGEALVHILALEMYARPLAAHLLAYPDLLARITRLIPWFEMVVPFLLFMPWATMRLRVLALVLLAGFHVSIGSLLATGLFPYVALTGLILFLPTALWDRVSGFESAGRATRPAEPRRGARRAAWLAGEVVVLALLTYVVAWNVVGLRLEEYWAAHRLGWAQERWRRGEKGALPILPRDAVVEMMLGDLGAVGRVANLHQRWDMFYSSGDLVGGWNVLVGTLPDGRKISLLEGGKPFQGDAHPKPARPVALAPNPRWRVYLTNLRAAGMQAVRDRFGAVAGRDWNRRHPEVAIDWLEVLFVQDPSSATPARERRTSVWFKGPVAAAGREQNGSRER